eukprot:363887-Chlamydomonas_euryale.AAC.19
MQHWSANDEVQFNGHITLKSQYTTPSKQHIIAEQAWKPSETSRVDLMLVRIMHRTFKIRCGEVAA